MERLDLFPDDMAPCVHCGSRSRRIERRQLSLWPSGQDLGTTFRSVCQQCNAATGWMSTPEMAAAQWECGNTAKEG